MTNQILYLSLLVLASCNAGAKNEKGNKTEKISTDTAVTTPADTTRPVSQKSNKIDIDTFGDISIGQRHYDTKKAIGEPDKRTSPEEWGADGLMHEDWTYTPKGLVLNMSSEKKSKDNFKTIFSITATAPCLFKTKAGLGIGNSYAEVKEAYKDSIDTDATDKNQITVGSIYGGIIFTFKDDKVNRIFLGAAAE